MAVTAEFDDDATVANAAGPREDDTADVPELLGRYRVVGLLGRGGMGRVYRALDETLGREVALKLLPTERLRPDRIVALRREARAMARLQHDHVVQVFSIESHAGRDFIAMELVEGSHLGRWLGNGERTADAILDAFLQAGEGLDAAHEAGVIHRDFKPSNVLVGEHGRIKVGDFGLARTWMSSPVPETVSQTSGMPARNDEMTFTGSAVGTPTYMPPEQHRGETADELSDQYAFCVALWYALANRSPFAEANGSEALLAAKEAGPPSLPSRVQVSRAVAAAIERGMEPRPSNRWPSMRALTQAITRGRSRRRWVPWAAALAVAVAVPLALDARADSTEATCVPDDAAAQWTRMRPDVDAALRAAAGGRSSMPARAMERLDAYASAWTQARTDACAAGASEDGETRERCVINRGREFIALAQAHREPAGLDPNRVLPALAKLSSVDSCNTEDPAPVEAHPGVMMVAAMHRAGRYEGAQKEVEALLRDPSLPAEAHADAQRLLGELQHKAGDSQTALESLTQAYFDAESMRLYDVAFSAAIRIAFIHAEVFRRFDHAQRWLDQARAMIQRAGEPIALRAAFETARGTLADGEGRYDDAEQAFSEAIELHSQASDDPLAVAAPLNNRASARAARGDYDGAIEDCKLAAALFEAGLGEEHPNVIIALSNLTANLHQAARYAEVLEVCDTLDARVRAVHSGPHEALAGSLNQRGLALKRLGRLDEAERAFVQSIEVREELGEQGPHAALAWVNLGSFFLERGQVDDAEPWLVKGRETLERTLGAQHPATAQVLGNVARLRHAQARYEEAVALLDTSISALVATFGTQHPIVASFYFYRAQARREAGDPKAAQVDYESALGIFDAAGGTPHDHAATQLELAQLLLEADPRSARAGTLLEAAAKQYDALGQPDDAATARAALP